MLDVAGLSVAYGQHRALDDVSIRVEPREIVVILGANGAGKSTLLRAIGGVCEGTAKGTIEMDGASLLAHEPHVIVEAGIALVPEGRGIFADLTVHENLLLGAYADRGRVEQQNNLDRVMSLFPKLVERRSQVVRTMSGGEQQMVAIGRGIMSAPAILMLDEPSLGLSPLLCRELFACLAEVRKSGIGILLVEQNAKQSLAIADRGYLLENGRIMGEDTAANLANDPSIQKAYLGVSGKVAAPVVYQPPIPAAVSRLETVADQAADPSADVAAQFSMDEVGRRTPRSRTDDLIGESIDDLVKRAASRQADYADYARVDTGVDRTTSRPPTNGAAGNRRLREVLAEIERAAVDARLGPSEPAASTAPESPRTNGTATPRKPKQNPEHVDDLPTIEVWKREPSVEIYRRKTDGDDKTKLVKS